MTDSVRALVSGELSRPVAPEVAAFAEELVRIGGSSVRSVLFYGSALRTGDLDGVLDFYVLVDDQRGWPQGWLAAWLGGRLPPNVEYREFEARGRRLRAKIAVLTPCQFLAASQLRSRDTTIWARFAQPAGLVWSAGEAMRDEAVQAVATAVIIASEWAAFLGPAAGPPAAFWNALFKQTYRVELRIEPAGRERAILGDDADRYGRILPLAWEAAGRPFERLADGTLRPHFDEAERRRFGEGWARCRRWGKPLTVLRLMKAVFTYQGAADYAAWKIQRHTGVRIEITPFVRKHPILAAPGVAWTLWKKGVLR